MIGIILRVQNDSTLLYLQNYLVCCPVMLWVVCDITFISSAGIGVDSSN